MAMYLPSIATTAATAPTVCTATQRRQSLTRRATCLPLSDCLSNVNMLRTKKSFTSWKSSTKSLQHYASIQSSDATQTPQSGQHDHRPAVSIRTQPEIVDGKCERSLYSRALTKNSVSKSIQRPPHQMVLNQPRGRISNSRYASKFVDMTFQQKAPIAELEGRWICWRSIQNKDKEQVQISKAARKKAEVEMMKYHEKIRDVEWQTSEMESTRN